MVIDPRIFVIVFVFFVGAIGYIGLLRNRVWPITVVHFTIVTFCVMGASPSWGISLFVPVVLDLPIITPLYFLAVNHLGLAPQYNLALAFIAFSVFGTFQWFLIGRIIQHRENKIHPRVIALILIAFVLVTLALIKQSFKVVDFIYRGIWH